MGPGHNIGTSKPVHLPDAAAYAYGYTTGGLVVDSVSGAEQAMEER